MLAKKYRLSGSANFKRVEKEGRVFQMPDFGVAHVQRNDSLPSKFGFVISTKIAKGATDRNRIRRAMSEAVRMSSVDLKPGMDVVFLAKLSVIKSPTDKIMRDVYAALKEGGFIK
ncbi:MAG TPA: ribonuclease P protein component [Patescibacteria group bacterium]|nr:ribonuclease P protein component [Patescibacteria group bacterium]